MDIAKFVRNELQKLPGSRGLRYDSGNAWIRCPDHGGGNENTASCKINLTDSTNAAIGSFYCFGCPYHGGWNMLAERLNLKIIKKNSLYEDRPDTDIKASDVDALLKPIITEEPSLDVLPWDSKDDWRGISGKLVHDIGGVMSLNRQQDDIQLVLPVYTGGEKKGEIYCLVKKVEGQKSYINEPGPWKKGALFPYDYVAEKIKKDKKKVVFVVEGPRDALNLIQLGFNAVAILGTKSWNDNKGMLVQSLNPELVVLAFDPDEAGDMAYKKAVKYFKNKVTTLRLKMKAKTDPANITEKMAVKLRKVIAAKTKEIEPDFTEQREELGL